MNGKKTHGYANHGKPMSRRDLLSARIKLHRALGGSWTAGLVVPDRTPRK